MRHVQALPYDNLPRAEEAVAMAREGAARDIAAGMAPGLAHGSQARGLAYYMRHRKLAHSGSCSAPPPPPEALPAAVHAES